MSEPQLTQRQQQVLSAIKSYKDVTGQPAPAPMLARTLNINRGTVRIHLRSLHQKNFLRSPGSPAYLRDDRP